MIVVAAMIVAAAVVAHALILRGATEAGAPEPISATGPTHAGGGAPAISGSPPPWIDEARAAITHDGAYFGDPDTSEPAARPITRGSP